MASLYADPFTYDQATPKKTPWTGDDWQMPKLSQESRAKIDADMAQIDARTQRRKKLISDAIFDPNWEQNVIASDLFDNKEVNDLRPIVERRRNLEMNQGGSAFASDSPNRATFEQSLGLPPLVYGKTPGVPNSGPFVSARSPAEQYDIKKAQAANAIRTLMNRTLSTTMNRASVDPSTGKLTPDNWNEYLKKIRAYQDKINALDPTAVSPGGWQGPSGGEPYKDTFTELVRRAGEGDAQAIATYNKLKEREARRKEIAKERQLFIQARAMGIPNGLASAWVQNRQGVNTDANMAAMFPGLVPMFAEQNKNQMQDIQNQRQMLVGQGDSMLDSLKNVDPEERKEMVKNAARIFGMANSLGDFPMMQQQLGTGVNAASNANPFVPSNPGLGILSETKSSSRPEMEWKKTEDNNPSQSDLLPISGGGTISRGELQLWGFDDKKDPVYIDREEKLYADKTSSSKGRMLHKTDKEKVKNEVDFKKSKNAIEYMRKKDRESNYGDIIDMPKWMRNWTPTGWAFQLGNMVQGTKNL